MPEELHRITSAATQKNWSRLSVTNTSQKLTARANKRLSKKHIIPLEYVSSPSCVEWVRCLLTDTAENHWEISDVMYSLCRNLLQRHALWKHPYATAAFSDLPEYRLIEEVFTRPLPMQEHDLPGLVYQSLLSEGSRSCNGTYYTPPDIVRDMLHDLPAVFQRCIDPCCGSGAFLIALFKKGIPIENIFGCDKDPIAVMLARTNLLIACRTSEAAARIVCADFLRDTLPFPETFDLIITNPPWGALSEKMKCGQFFSAESFSCFLYAACQRLSSDGILRFLLPESFLSVRTHRAIRRYLLTQKSLREIRFYDQSFSGVTTRCISIEVHPAAENDLISLRTASSSAQIPASFYLQNEDCTLYSLSKIDFSIIRKIHAFGVHSLKGSLWALGIVTGNNREKLFDVPKEGCKPIFTGKEIDPYVLRPAQKYIFYDRSSLQQAAPDEFYRAEEKLIYRFICDRPVFALDTSGTLCLNSANILIPKLPGLSTCTILALLNSFPLQYLYMKQSGGVKALKSHLEKLPLPALTQEQDHFISTQVQKILSADSQTRLKLHEEINEYLYSLYGFSDQEIQHIRSTAMRFAKPI